MKTQARVVVIGGGIVGCSTLYHLAQASWSDVMLVERKELTSGSTWHAAGLLPLFNMSYSVGQIHKYSVQFYHQLQQESELSLGLKIVSNIRLATNSDRMDEYHQYAGVARTIGVNVEFLTPHEVKQIWPLCNTKGIIGAIRHPDDGYVQSADLTQALAAAARKRGAHIVRQTTVTGIHQRPSGEWLVETDKGNIVCEHVVSASGNFARATGALVGLDIPVIPVQHQYLVTEPHPLLQERKANGLPELGVLRDPDGSWYLREENSGFIIGPYEKNAPACYVDGPSADCEYELFEEDLDRLTPHIESAIARVPEFANVGIKQTYNGAICYTPDGNPIIGPAWGLRNFWLNEGHSFGITAAGGAGFQLAQWITSGEPTIDMLSIDPRRFGDYASKRYLTQKNEEAYRNVFSIHYPDEERPAGRPLRTAPCYERMRDLGAVFGQKSGFERPNWFAPAGLSAVDDWSFRRSRWFTHVGNECRNVAENIGLLDMTAFAKCRISGAGAAAFLDHLLANRIPKRCGPVRLCHALNTAGGVHSEFTLYRESENSFYLVSAGAYQRLDHDWIWRHMPQDGSVSYQNLTNQIGVLVLAGPKSRVLLERVSSDDWSNYGFPWLTARRVGIGLAECLAMRLNFVGELGFELHHPIEYQNHIFDTLMTAGAHLGLAPFGIRAMDSLRIEKSYRMVGTELSIEYAAFESDLQRFVHPNKGDFIGREALAAWSERGFKNQLVTLAIDGIKDADALGNNPIFDGATLVGRATSGNYGFRVNRSLAMAMVTPSYATLGTQLQIDILGSQYLATVIAESPYDQDNTKLQQ